MEKKKISFGTAATNAGKAAASFLEKTKKAVINKADQTGDGKLGLADVASVTESVKTKVNDRKDKWNNTQEQKKREKEFESLHPIFDADVDTPEFSLPKLIRVAEMDKKHAESDLCKDSVGYIFSEKEVSVVTIYPEKIADFGLSFYPDMESEVYYVDPTDRDLYVALDNYFNYLRVARIGELQKIAQDLGAKHFRVTYKEQKKTFNSISAGGKAAFRIAGNNGNVDASHQRQEDSYSKIEIAAEMECIGHKPVEPVLKYFKKDPQIQSLVSLRMADNAMTHQVYTLNFSSSTGIKIKDAIKIDAALSAMKINGSANITSEVQNEDRRIFEYEIDF